MLFSRGKLDRYLHSQNGEPPWALVTGASDGIGRQFADVLASRGFNVIIHGRNAQKVQLVIDDLSRAHPNRAFRALIANAVHCSTGGHSPLLEALLRPLDDLNLTVLVNNAGGADPSLRPLQHISSAELASNILLNATFPTLLTARLLPLLMRHEPSLVLNVGSMSDAALPLTAAYSASKAYLACLSAQLRREMMLEGRDVEVLCVRLGTTTGTALNKTPPSFFMPDAKTVAEAALESVGCGRAIELGAGGMMACSALLAAIR
ncbi:Uu.00g139820.m01.CDS01 [Anthostomella pinea]|uniref:Uu.00g139820.m01.CDS01 n=1 Tax=Anthostomella pinea TaxID=933095 RepID=A0AAI8YIX6_9PEZI|nr:Uu.00g139820.m01.CDS01 [Anthostomella pinea]